MRRSKPTSTVTVLSGGSAQSSWPIDAVYISFSSANPSTLFGGTWVSIGSGKMLISVDAADATMDVAGDTGGQKTFTLAAANLPQHAHTINHDHAVANLAMYWAANTTIGGTAIRVTNLDTLTGGGGTSETVTVDVPSYSGNSGSGNSPISATPTPVNNLPPYVAVYMWRRTA